MISKSASAPGKIIMFGEHAVVYGQPAIAVPVTQVQATASISSLLSNFQDQILIEAPDINLVKYLSDLPEHSPFPILISTFKNIMGLTSLPSIKINISSTIPIAAGLGSGAATSIAIIRALSEYLGLNITNEVVSDISFQTEIIYHVTPSGIDNTVISFRQPIYFHRDHPFVLLNINEPFLLLIAHSGEKSKTGEMVERVRNRWLAENKRFEKMFCQIGKLAIEARNVIEHESYKYLGVLMNNNHKILQEIGVSTKKIDQLIQVALSAGAIGAKLSGSGGGGNLIALLEPDNINRVVSAFQANGISQIIISKVDNQD